MQTKTLNLIYRATKDGFQASNFHTKADGIANTLTIIKTTNGNIFGGYTVAAWNSNDIWQTDPTAFLFSLVNPQNVAPYKIMISELTYTIYSRSINGPIFGGGHDLYISNSSNTNNNSYNNIQSYPNPNGYMDGGFNFQTVEIELYTIIN